MRYLGAILALLMVIILMIPSITISQTPIPPTPPANDLVTIEGYISYYDVNNNINTGAGLLVYAVYSNGTIINYSDASTITSSDGYYKIQIPRPSDNLTSICIANLSYCTGLIDVTNATALNPLELNITVPRLSLTDIQGINSSKVIIVFGSTPKWGPRKWDATTDDMRAAGFIAQALPNATLLSDSDVAVWNASTNKLSLKTNLDYVANSELIVTVGGFGANAVTWKYAFKPTVRLDSGPQGKPVLLLPDGSEILFNGTLGRFFYINNSGIYNVTEITWLNAKSDRFGKVDFAVVFIERDIALGKKVVVVEGFTRFGTTAAGLWLKNAIQSNSLPSGKAIVVLVWNDTNGNGIVDPNEIQVIAEY